MKPYRRPAAAQPNPSPAGNPPPRRDAFLRLLRRAEAAALLALALDAAPAALAQTAPATPSLTGTSPVAGTAPGAQKPTAASAEPGKTFAEILRGNGTRAGYLLSHGGVAPESLQVRVGGRVLRPNFDYWLDAAGGALAFAQSVGRFDSVSVSYRYSETADKTRQPNAIPGLSLQLGQNARLGLVYDTAPGGGGEGLNTSAYGLSLGGTFGQGGASRFRSLAFFSNTQKSDNITLPTLENPEGKSKADESRLGGDKLLVQNLALASGGLRLRADFQEVGEKFNGFSSLRSSAGTDAAFLSEIAALEGEKGVTRLGFGLGFGGGGKGKENHGLSLDWGQIEDGKGSIARQSASLAGENFRLGYTSRSVDKTFERFAGLREADKEQWAKEKGLTSTALSFGFGFGKAAAGAARPGLDFVNQNFGDDSGSLRRSSLSLNAGALGVTLLSRQADKAFTRLGDLSAADRAALALDLYRQYDPSAKAEQVTASDVAQVAKEAGFNRDALRASLGSGKSGLLRVSHIRLTDVTPGAKGADGAEDTKEARSGLRRDSVDLSAGAFSFSLVNRRTDADFSRLADLADVEKNALALDIRRQFNPDASLAEVTQKERDQSLTEAGLRRSSLRARWMLGRTGKDGKKTGAGLFEFGAFSIASAGEKGEEGRAPGGAIRRQAMRFENGSLRFSLADQSIDSTMSRLAALGEFERAQFANESGLKKRELGLSWQPNKVTRIGLTSLRVGSTPEAIAALARKSQETTDGTPESALPRDEDVRRDALTIETKNFSFAANSASVGKDFARAADLALPDLTKQEIAAERGFVRSDYATKFTLFKALSVDGYRLRSRSESDERGRDAFRTALALAPNKKTSLNFLSTGDLMLAEGKRNGTEQTLFTLDHNFGRGVALNLLRDDNAAYDKGEAVGGAKTDLFKFSSDQARPNRVAVESRRVAYQTGHYERARSINLHVKPVKSLSVGYSLSDVQRGAPEEKSDLAPSETINALALQLQASPNFSVVAGVSERNAEDDKNVKTLSVGLEGMPVRNLTVSARFDEVHHVSSNVKDVADFSVSNSKPISIGPLEGLTMTARYASLNDKKIMQNEAMTGRLAFSLWKSKFLLDYGGYKKPDGSTISRVYQFETDPNPARKFHGGLMYKSRTLINGTEHAIRRFNAALRLGKATKFSYLYGTLPEDEKGSVLPQETADVSLSHEFPRGLAFVVFYRLSDNGATKILTRSLGLGLEGQLDRTSKLTFRLSADADGGPDRHDSANTLRLAYERAVGPDHYLRFAADIRSHSIAGTPDEVTASLDLRLRF